MIDPLAADRLAGAALPCAGGVVAGVAMGFGYFSALRWNVGLFLRGERAVAILVLIGRLAAVGAVFIALATFGALPLLAGGGGFMFARRLALRRLGAFPAEADAGSASETPKKQKPGVFPCINETRKDSSGLEREKIG